MRFLAKPVVWAGLALLATSALAQDRVLVERNITLPKNAIFGGEALARGTYRLALVEVATPQKIEGAGQSEVWFVIRKGGREIARDVAVELPASELPTRGVQTEILKGGEYFRVRVRRGDKVYLIHFLLEGGKA